LAEKIKQKYSSADLFPALKGEAFTVVIATHDREKKGILKRIRHFHNKACNVIED